MSMPANELEKALNKRISLLLKDGRVLDGKLLGFDDYMNMVLDEVEEKVEDLDRKIGKIVLRGNTVVSVTIL